VRPRLRFNLLFVDIVHVKKLNTYLLAYLVHAAAISFDAKSCIVSVFKESFASPPPRTVESVCGQDRLKTIVAHNEIPISL